MLHSPEQQRAGVAVADTTQTQEKDSHPISASSVARNGLSSNPIAEALLLLAKVGRAQMAGQAEVAR